MQLVAEGDLRVEFPVSGRYGDRPGRHDAQRDGRPFRNIVRGIRENTSHIASATGRLADLDRGNRRCLQEVFRNAEIQKMTAERLSSATTESCRLPSARWRNRSTTARARPRIGGGYRYWRTSRHRHSGHHDADPGIEPGHRHRRDSHPGDRTPNQPAQPERSHRGGQGGEMGRGFSVVAGPSTRAGRTLRERRQGDWSTHPDQPGVRP